MIPALISAALIGWFLWLAITCLRLGRPVVAAALLVSLFFPPIALGYAHILGAMTIYAALLMVAISLSIASFALATMPEGAPARRWLVGSAPLLVLALVAAIWIG